MIEYNKLVRDMIIDIIRKEGKRPSYYTATEAEYPARLGAKLIEEIGEYLDSRNPEELADILEVVYAIAETHGISREKLESMRLEKKIQKGGFEKRIVLESVE